MDKFFDLIDRAGDLEDDLPGWAWGSLHLVAVLLAMPCLLYGALVGAVAYLCDAVAFVVDKLRLWNRD